MRNEARIAKVRSLRRRRWLIAGTMDLLIVLVIALIILLFTGDLVRP